MKNVDIDGRKVGVQVVRSMLLSGTQPARNASGPSLPPYISTILRLFRGIHGVMIVYDVTDRQSFLEI